MVCPRCAKPVPPGAGFCPACGAPLRAATPQPQPRPQPGQSGGYRADQMGRMAAPTPPSTPTINPAAQFAAQQKRNRWILAGIGALALIGAFVGLKAFGSLQRGATSKPPALQLSSVSPSPGLQLPAQTQPAPLQKTAEVITMPADIEAWLKHLEKCEQEKVTIAGDQTAEVSVWMTKMQALGPAMGLMNPYDQSSDGAEDQAPTDYAKGKMLDLRPRWRQLVDFFNSVPPPAECVPIASDYNRALSQIPDAMGDLGDILNGAMEDPQKALSTVKKIQNGSYDEIDRYFSRTDQKVSEVCTKYNKSKWFNVKSDVLAGGMMGKFGNAMPGSGAMMGGGL